MQQGYKSFHDDYLNYEYDIESLIKKKYDIKQKYIFLHCDDSNIVPIKRNFSGIMDVAYYGFINNGTSPLPTLLTLRNLLPAATPQHYIFSNDIINENHRELILPTVLLHEPISCAFFEKIDGKITQGTVKILDIAGNPINISGTFIFKLELGRDL
jgi:hypothetical protein